MKRKCMTKFGPMILISPLLVSSLSCGNIEVNDHNSSANAAPKSQLKSYYEWIYADPTTAGQKRAKAAKVEDFLVDKDIFRLTAEQMKSYYALCDDQAVPRDICNDVLDIQRFYRNQDNGSDCHKDGCKLMTCGVTSC